MTFNEDEYIVMGCMVIRNYLRQPWLTDIDIQTKYEYALLRLVENWKNYDENVADYNGIASISEGSQSMSFDSNTRRFSITQDVIALLPPINNIYCW